MNPLQITTKILEKFDKEIKSLESSISDIETKLGTIVKDSELEDKFKQLEGRFLKISYSEKIENRLDTAVENVDTMESKLSDIKEEIKGLQSNQETTTLDSKKLLEATSKKVEKLLATLEEIKIQKDEMLITFKGEQGMQGECGMQGNDGKDGSPDTAEQIVTKLNTQEEAIDQKVIKGLTKKIADISQNIAHSAVEKGAKLYTGTSEARVRELISTTAGTGSGTVGPGTINEIAYFDSASTVASLAVATYPSLTELSYGKGVTSAIQTQLNAKASLTTPVFVTNITTPLVIGGTTTTSPLTLRSTSGVGTTGADIIFQVGNNGATEAGRFLNSGAFLLGATTALGTESMLIRKSQAGTTGFTISNPNVAAGAYAQITLTNETGYGAIGMNGTGSTGGGFFGTANQTYIYSAHAAGLAFGAYNAAGTISFYTAGYAAANEKMRITASGTVAIGTTTPYTGGTTSLHTNVVGSNYNFNMFTQYSTDATYFPYFFQAKGRGTQASPTVVIDGDTLGAYGFGGQKTTTLNDVWIGASIRGIARGTFATNNNPTDITFWTTPASSGNQAERMRLTSAGTLAIGTTTPYSALTTRLHTSVDGSNYNNNVMSQFSTDSTYFPMFNFYKGRGTQASPTATQTGDILGRMIFAGQYDTTLNNFANGAYIQAIAKATFAAGTYTTDLQFFTTATSAAVERMRILSDGTGYFGSTAAIVAGSFFAFKKDQAAAATTLQVENRTSSGMANVKCINDTTGMGFGIYGTTATPYGACAAGNGYIYGATNFTIMAEGASTYINFAAGGTGEKLRLSAVGNLKLLGTAGRSTTEGTGHLDIFDGTAPVGTLANGVSLYSASGYTKMMNAAGLASHVLGGSAVTTEAVVSDTTVTIEIGGVTYKLLAKA